jgi:hypothetical protein
MYLSVPISFVKLDTVLHLTEPNVLLILLKYFLLFAENARS